MVWFFVNRWHRGETYSLAVFKSTQSDGLQEASYLTFFHNRAGWRQKLGLGIPLCLAHARSKKPQSTFYGQCDGYNNLIKFKKPRTIQDIKILIQ